MFATALCALMTASGAVRQDDTWLVSQTMRQRLTHISAPDFDAESTIQLHWTQRLTVNLDRELNSGISLHAELISAINSETASPADRNILDIHQAYLDVPLGDGHLRLGRHRVALGSQRLIGTRLGTNVPRTWDGVSMSQSVSKWQFEALALRLVSVEPEGVFNDSATDAHQLAGLYGKRPIGPGSLDLYALTSWRDDKLTIEGRADQTRHSVGARWSGDRGAWTWNFEAVYQFGEHGALDISAWTLASITQYQLDTPGSPRLSLSANIASGDRSNGDGTLGTFDALYPRGNYFSELALLGPSNFINVHPRIVFQSGPDWETFADINLYWRLDDEDGVYTPSGAILRAPLNEPSNTVSQSVTVGTHWRATPSVGVELAFTHVKAGRFIERTGTSDAITFLELTITKDF